MTWSSSVLDFNFYSCKVVKESCGNNVWTNLGRLFLKSACLNCCLHDWTILSLCGIWRWCWREMLKHILQTNLGCLFLNCPVNRLLEMFSTCNGQPWEVEDGYGTWLGSVILLIHYFSHRSWNLIGFYNSADSLLFRPVMAGNITREFGLPCGT